MQAISVELRDDQNEALEREARNSGRLPAEIVADLVGDWLVAKGNLRLF